MGLTLRNSPLIERIWKRYESLEDISKALWVGSKHHEHINIV
jgi:hypothetical protein